MPAPAGQGVEIVKAHIVKVASLAIVAATLTASPAWAEDVEGSRDHPALTRFEGAEIRAYEHKDYDEALMPDRPVARESEAKGLTLEGKLTRIAYRIDGKKSALEVYRNYQARCRPAASRPCSNARATSSAAATSSRSS